jgi:long-chain acyl-CoA synthetase
MTGPMTDSLLGLTLAQSAMANADRLALRGEDLDLSYRDLLSRARGLAARLRDAGLARDDAVMLTVSNHPLDFVAFLAIWLAAGVVVPVHRSSPPGVVDAIQAKAQCRYRVDLLSGDGSGSAITALPAPEESPERSRMLRGAALVIFTSGSTGLPKGVVLSHEAFAGKLVQNQKLLGMTADDVTLLVLNNSFSFGLWLALLALNHGGSVVTRAKFSPLQFVDTLIAERVSRVGVVPTMIRATFAALSPQAIDQAGQRLRTAGQLRDMVIGGEPLGAALSVPLRSFIAPARLYDVYGLTETSTSDFVLEPPAYPAHPATIGLAAPGVRYRISDERGADCAVDAAGELQLQTPYIMAGYLGDLGLTQAAFVDGWFRTGDLASRDADGFVTIVGRLKELIVRGGNKITPLEVERALCACPGVAAAMALGLADPVLGQRIHALLIPAAGQILSAAAIRAGLATSLEKFKQPDACYVGTELPTGRTGKLDRGQLQAWLRSGALPLLAGWAQPGATPTERPEPPEIPEPREPPEPPVPPEARTP